MSVKRQNRVLSTRHLARSLVLAAVAALPLNVALAHASPGRPELAAQRVVLTPAIEKPLAALLPAPPPPAPLLPAAGAAPPPAPPVDNSIEGIIRAAAWRAGANPQEMLRVAACESGFNPHAYNGRSGASGLFQFLPYVFRSHGGDDIWDARQQADIAARMFAAGWGYQWSCR